MAAARVAVRPVHRRNAASPASSESHVSSPRARSPTRGRRRTMTQRCPLATSALLVRAALAAAAAVAITAATVPAAATAVAVAAAAVAPSAARAAAVDATADAADVAACVGASRAHVRRRLPLFGGEAPANAFKDALARRAAALADTDGSGVGEFAGDGFWHPPPPPSRDGDDGVGDGDDGDGDGTMGGGDGGGTPTRATSRLPPPPLVVDVGANRAQGFPAWRAAFPGATIVAVEANPGLLVGLGRVPPAGGRTHVIHAAVGAVAAGEEAAIFRMPIHEDDDQTGGLWVGEARPEQHKYRYVVRLRGGGAGWGGEG